MRVLSNVFRINLRIQSFQSGANFCKTWCQHQVTCILCLTFSGVREDRNEMYGGAESSLLTVLTSDVWCPLSFWRNGAGGSEGESAELRDRPQVPRARGGDEDALEILSGHRDWLHREHLQHHQVILYHYLLCIYEELIGHVLKTQINIFLPMWEVVEK